MSQDLTSVPKSKVTLPKAGSGLVDRTQLLLKRIRFSFHERQRSGLLKRLKDDNQSLETLITQQRTLKLLGFNINDQEVGNCRSLQQMCLGIVHSMSKNLNCAKDEECIHNTRLSLHSLSIKAHDIVSRGFVVGTTAPVNTVSITMSTGGRSEKRFQTAFAVSKCSHYSGPSIALCPWIEYVYDRAEIMIDLVNPPSNITKDSVHRLVSLVRGYKGITVSPSRISVEFIDTLSATTALRELNDRFGPGLWIELTLLDPARSGMGTVVGKVEGNPSKTGYSACADDFRLEISEIVASNIESISLSEILTANRPYSGFPGYFFERDRARLAATLVSSVLCLHNTPWLKDPSWTRLVSFELDKTRDLSRYSLQRPFRSLSLPLPTDSSDPATDLTPLNEQFGVLNPMLYSLGMVLLELVMNEPLDNLRLNETETEIQIAWRVEREVCRRSGPRWADIISACLHCPLHQEPNLENDDFLGKIIAAVLTPLEEMADL